MNPLFTHIVCLECGAECTADVMASSCERCSSRWLDARYDYRQAAAVWKSELRDRERDLWRYGELLPMASPDWEITMGEGYSPLIRIPQYERQFNHEYIYVKDERQTGPTSSFKDRQAALAVMAMHGAGITECVLSSTGNAGAAYAAYCARAGIKLWLFLTSLVPAEKMREAALYGAEVIKVSGTYDETKQVAADFAKRKGLHLDLGARAIPGKEAMKTLAYEIAEQLGLQLHPERPGTWRSPDWYIQAVSGGIGPLGVWKGFEELVAMGLIDRVPKLGIVQAAGCAPMVNAFFRGDETATAVVPRTLITVLATGDPGHSYVQLRQAVMSNGGTMLAIEDGETFEAMRNVARRVGFSVEPATAVAFAGLEKMLTNGTIADGEVVVINCSGHTFPAESHILGDQYVLNLELSAQGDVNAMQRAQEEGLGAALKRLDEQVTTIVVVDDNPNDSRLIRRLLQSYKRYRVYEAHSGPEALQVIGERKPDLVVSDLTMPDMDGFMLLEKLKSNPATAHIPVVVVSAKTITAEDEAILDRYSDSVWTKGGFDTRQLVDHVVRVLGDTPVETIRLHRSHDSEMVAQLGGISVAIPGQYEVLVIDDNPRDTRLARKLLSATGAYHVREALTGRDGLKAIYEHRPDLILLDLRLPDMDGFEVLDALNKNADLRDIPVVIVSGRELTEREQAYVHATLRPVVEKASLERNSFLSIIDNALK